MTKTIRNVFLIAFIFSTLFGCGMLTMTFGFNPAAAPSMAPTPTPIGGQNITETEKSVVDTSIFALVGSLATSFVSLIGFVTTTVITWRKEKRESALADMECKKLELELEKSKMELEELKKNKKK